MSKNSIQPSSTSLDVLKGSNSVWRLPRVLAERSRSRSTHYADIQQGLFTRPVQIGLRAVGWPAYEVQVLNGARIAGQSHDQIRDLVKQLECARKFATKGV